MKRRRVLQTMLGAPAAVAAAPQSTSVTTAVAASEEFPKLPLEGAETAAAGMRTFFSKDQYAALEKLGDMLVPAYGGRPSASQAGVAAFLDFLVRESAPDAQQLWREGLQRLHDEGFRAELLAPLGEPWSYAGPADRFAQFLIQAKSDLLQAAAGSREWAESMGRGRRGSAPTGYFWRSVD